MLLENIKNIKQIGGGVGNFILFLIFGSILFFGLWALTIQSKKDTCIINVKRKYKKNGIEENVINKKISEDKKTFGLDDINPFSYTDDNFKNCINKYQVDDIIKN